ncbi:MAG: GIY-YIG nuclease family protein [Candidatus Portnoybacteria bacterium]|nr:GIY-YIG nuclease family protein [Candidatus Portnoybacteria bacterium]
MFYVYVLKSTVADWKYIGCCNDLKQRFLQHNNGCVKSTKARKPYELIYYEAYNNKAIARKRELELKNNNSKREELYKRLF